MKKKLMIAALAFCVTAGTVVGSVSLGKGGVLEADAAATLKMSKEASEKAASEETTEAEESSSDEKSSGKSSKNSDKESNKNTDKKTDEKSDKNSDETADAKTAEESEEASDADSKSQSGKEKDTEKAADTATEESTEESAEDAGEQLTISADESTLTVTGTGTSTVTPDKASISLGVQTTDSSSKTAQDKNSKTVNNVIDALLDAGIDEKNIKTSSFDLYANYDYSGDESKLTGYTVTTMLTVKGLDVSDVGELLETAGDAGVNVMNGISYEYSGYADAYDEALESAVERAQEKAEKLAAKTGCKLGKLVSITENSDGGYSSSDAKLAATEEASSDSGMTVMAGEDTVSASVTVVYQLSE